MSTTSERQAKRERRKKGVAKTGVRTLDSYENGVQVTELLRRVLAAASFGRKIKGDSYKTIALTTRPSWLDSIQLFRYCGLYAP